MKLGSITKCTVVERLKSARRSGAGYCNDCGGSILFGAVVLLYFYCCAVFVELWGTHIFSSLPATEKTEYQKPPSETATEWPRRVIRTP